MNKSDYKEKLIVLLESINDLVETSLLNLKGNFSLPTTERSTISSKGTTDSIQTSIIYNEVESLPIMTLETNLNAGSEYYKDLHWKNIYNDFLKYIFFAKDTRNKEYKSLLGNPVVIIPIGTLLKEGFKRD